MSYLAKFMPKAVQPYAAEIVGGAAGYAVTKMRAFNRLPVGRRMAIPFGMMVGSFVSEDRQANAMPNLVGLAAAWAIANRAPSFVRKLIKNERYGIGYYGLPVAAFVAGKTIAKKVGG